MNTIDTVLAVILSIFILCVVPVNFKKKTYNEVKQALLMSAINENAEDVYYVETLAGACDISLKSFVMTLEGEREKEFYPYLYYKDADKTDSFKGSSDYGVNEAGENKENSEHYLNLYGGRVVLYGY